MIRKLRIAASCFGLIALAIYVAAAIDPPPYDHLFHSATVLGIDLPGDRRAYAAVGVALLAAGILPWLRGAIRLAVIGLDRLRQLGERPGHGPRAWRG